MDLEARTLIPPLKIALLTKLREYKSDLNVLKREAKNFLVSIDSLSARNELIDSRPGGLQSRVRRQLKTLHQQGYLELPMVVGSQLYFFLYFPSNFEIHAPPPLLKNHVVQGPKS